MTGTNVLMNFLFLRNTDFVQLFISFNFEREIGCT
jgi:hypothetical protein